MDKEIGRITFTETEEGLRVEASGELVKKAMSEGCCLPLLACMPCVSTECCKPKKEQ